MNDQGNFKITQHARHRYIERRDKKHRHLSECRGCPRCQDLAFSILELDREKRQEIEAEILTRLNEADEVKSYLNNSEWMQRYYDRYGFDNRFQFLVDRDLVFVIVFEEGFRKVITVVYTKRHIVGAVAVRPKFRSEKT